MEQEKLGTGAHESINDPRTVKHEEIAFAGAPLVKGGVIYTADEHEHQHRVGICTGISRVQLRQRQTGKKYSPDFQYLLQKKYIDLDWNEGSSVFSSCKVAYTYGFLPEDLWSHTTEADRYLPYSQYIAKLQAIPDLEIKRLKKLCVDKIAGYARVKVNNAQSVAKAIIDSPQQAGILCRYGCQKNWWTPSWDAKDINPLRNDPETSGHAIINSFFDYSTGKSMQKLANTWGKVWCLEGNADINFDNYPMTEAYVDLLDTPVINPHPLTKKGDKGPVVKELQGILNEKTSFILKIDGDFGNKTLLAVVEFQRDNKLTTDGKVGPLTWKKLLE